MYITIFTEFLNLGREKTSDRCGWGNWTAAGRCQSDPDYCLWYGIPVSQTWTTWVDISYVHCPLSPLWTIFCLLPFFAASFPFLILIFRLLTKLMKTSKGTLLKTQCLNFAAKYVETYFVNKIIKLRVENYWKSFITILRFDNFNCFRSVLLFTWYLIKESLEKWTVLCYKEPLFLHINLYNEQNTNGKLKEQIWLNL